LVRDCSFLPSPFGPIILHPPSLSSPPFQSRHGVIPIVTWFLIFSFLSLSEVSSRLTTFADAIHSLDVDWFPKCSSPPFFLMFSFYMRWFLDPLRLRWRDFGSPRNPVHHGPLLLMFSFCAPSWLSVKPVFFCSSQTCRISPLCSPQAKFRAAFRYLSPSLFVLRYKHFRSLQQRHPFFAPVFKLNSTYSFFLPILPFFSSTRTFLRPRLIEFVLAFTPFSSRPPLICATGCHQVFS